MKNEELSIFETNQEKRIIGKTSIPGSSAIHNQVNQMVKGDQLALRCRFQPILKQNILIIVRAYSNCFDNQRFK